MWEQFQRSCFIWMCIQVGRECNDAGRAIAMWLLMDELELTHSNKKGENEEDWSFEHHAWCNEKLLEISHGSLNSNRLLSCVDWVCMKLWDATWVAVTRRCLEGAERGKQSCCSGEALVRAPVLHMESGVWHTLRRRKRKYQDAMMWDIFLCNGWLLKEKSHVGFKTLEDLCGLNYNKKPN